MANADLQLLHGKAEQGDVEAQVELAFSYALGKGVSKDRDKAFEWLYSAANRGHADAQSVLGVVFHEGLWGIQKNYQEALKWHRLAANQGWVPSLLDLGLMYDNGRGVPEDGKAAFGWFRAALLEGRGGNTPAHVEQLEKLMAMFLVRIAEASSGSTAYPYLSSYDDRRNLAREIGAILYRIGGIRTMKRALDEYVGRIPGQRTIDQFWDGIGEWCG